MRMKQLLLENEVKEGACTSVYTVYVDKKKIGEHLRMDEALRLINMIESGEVHV